MTIKLHFTLEELSKTAQKILENVQSKTVLFYGEMGTGKTTLISAIVKEMGGTEPASSPTFSIVNEYKLRMIPYIILIFTGSKPKMKHWTWELKII